MIISDIYIYEKKKWVFLFVRVCVFGVYVYAKAIRVIMTLNFVIVIFVIL